MLGDARRVKGVRIHARVAVPKNEGGKMPAVPMFTGFRDTICPLSAQFAMYNKVKSKKNVRIYPEYGHESMKDTLDQVFCFLSDL